MSHITYKTYTVRRPFPIHRITPVRTATKIIHNLSSPHNKSWRKLEIPHIAGPRHSSRIASSLSICSAFSIFGHSSTNGNVAASSPGAYIRRQPCSYRDAKPLASSVLKSNAIATCGRELSSASRGSDGLIASASAALGPGPGPGPGPGLDPGTAPSSHSRTDTSPLEKALLRSK